MVLLNRLPVLWKVLSVPAIAIVCMAVYLGSTAVVFSNNNNRLVHVRDVQFPVLGMSTELSGELDKIIDTLNTAATTGDVDVLETADGIAAHVRENLAKLTDIDKEHSDQLQRLAVEFNRYYAASRDIANMMAQKSGVPTKERVQEMASALAEYRKDMTSYRNDAVSYFSTTINDATVEANHAMLAGVIIGLLGLGATLGFGVLVARILVSQMRSAIHVAETVASGNLTSDIHSPYNEETGQLLRALRNMNDSLVSIVSQVRLGTDSIASDSNVIAKGNLDLSDRTEHEVQAIAKAADAVEKLSVITKRCTEFARQANTLVTSASSVATKGGSMASQMAELMNRINGSSRKIADIVGMIEGIAFQTNILALNAAVEAARAGDQGRGFAVVATEVRSLAQRSAEAAKEITALINHSVEQVRIGAQLAEQTNSTMTDIVSNVGQVTNIISEIGSASLQQATGLNQVNQAITELSQVTNENVALVDETAATAQSLQDRAENLEQVVSLFKISETSRKTLMQVTLFNER